MGLNGRGKVMALIKHLGITLDQFRRNIGIPRIIFESILMEKSDIPLRSKIKIMNLYPEISNVWLEFGGNYMTDGLKPNTKLLKVLYKFTNTDNLNDLMKTKLVNYLGRNPNMTPNHLKKILTNKCQIGNREAKYLCKELGLNICRLMSLDDEELKCNKVAVQSLVYKLNGYQIKSRIYNDDSRTSRRKLVDDTNAGPIYRYMKDKIDPMYLDHSKLNELLGRSDCRALLTRYTHLSERTAKTLCDRFKLDYDDMLRNNIIRTYSVTYKSKFYEMVKDKLIESDLTVISSMIGVSYTSFRKHLKGHEIPGAKAAFKYYLYFDMDFSGITSNKMMYLKMVEKHKKASQKACTP